MVASADLATGSSNSTTTPTLINELGAQRIAGQLSIAITSDFHQGWVLWLEIVLGPVAQVVGLITLKGGSRQVVPSRSIAQHTTNRRRATATIAVFLRAGLPRRTDS